MGDRHLDLRRQAWIADTLSAQDLVGVLLLDAGGRIVHANGTACRWLVHDEPALRTLNFRALMSAGGRLFYDTQLEPMMRLHREWREVALELLPAQGASLPVLASAIACAEEDEGQPLVLVTLFRATERRRYERELLRARQAAEQTALALFDEKERARVTLDSVGEGVLVVDADGRMTYLNAAAERLTGCSPAVAVGRPIESVLPLLHDVDPSAGNPLRAALSGAGPTPVSGLLPVPGDAPRTLEGTVASIRARDGRTAGAVAVLRDVSEARRLQQRLTYQATHDQLTGVPNRAEFERALSEALDEARSGGRAHALLFLDLDGFKMVNDTCGHLAGDELLRQVAQLMASQSRGSDMLARIGGDEFGILLRHCSLENGQRLAESVVAAMAAFRFGWESQHFRLGVSVGVAAVDALCPDAGWVLSAADSACGRAKHLGRNQVQVFHRDDLQLRELHEQKDWLGKLNRALTRDALELHVQRICRINGGAGPRHYEVLLRLRQDDGSLVAPALFLPVAERYRLMTRIDEWVVGRLLAMLAPDAGRLLGRHEFAVNLSGSSINDPAFLDFLLDAFARHRVPGALVCFEITETVAIANFNQAVEFIRRLSALGCRFALDDFGAGLSSFEYLRKLPVQVVKIDGAFVDGLASDPISRAMVEAIRQVSRLMQLETVAERVECDADLQTLRELGIDFAQGYVLHRPEPLAGLDLSD